MEKKFSYQAKGFVLGTTWLDSKGAYSTKLVEGNSIEEIESKINHMIESNILDNGMGFKNLIGALMTIRIITEIEIDGDKYINTKYHWDNYGTLTYDEELFLEEQVRDFGIDFPPNY